MTTPLVVIGGGGHARVIIDTARSSGAFEVLGFLDPGPCADTASLLHVRRLGDDHRASELVATAGGLRFVMGIGAVGLSPQRLAIIERYDQLEAKWAAVIHADATVASTARVEHGAVVLAGAILGPGAEIGRHGIVNSGAIVEHDVHVGDYVVLGPGAILGGGCQIGGGAFIGLGARIRDHVRVGPNAFVAMGAVVVKDVPPMASVAGVPARLMEGR